MKPPSLLLFFFFLGRIWLDIQFTNYNIHGFIIHVVCGNVKVQIGAFDIGDEVDWSGKDRWYVV